MTLIEIVPPIESYRFTRYKCICECGTEKFVSYDNCVSSFTFNGIDRKNNNLGYTYDNCVTACTTCNKAKNSMTIEEFK